MRRLVAGVALAFIVATSAAAARAVSPWTVIWDHDQDIGLPYAQCPVEPGMSENDEWTWVAEGWLDGTVAVSNPRPTCMGMVARAGAYWFGKGKAPELTLEILDPTGGVTSRTVVAPRQRGPVRVCFENLSLYATGTYTFRLTGTGEFRLGALVMQKEFDNLGCDWWPSQLGSWGL